MDEDNEVPLEFTGVFLRKDKNGSLTIDQQEYLNKKPLPILTKESTYSEFSSARMRLAWMSHTRLDLLYDINQFAQVTEAIFSSHKSEIIEAYSKCLYSATEEPLSIRFPKLEKSSLKILGVSDASFANNRDLSSQLGYILFLSDTKSVIPIIFKSYKSKRVTKSPMSAEVIAFADMFDAGIALKREIEWMIGQKVPLQLLTDSKCMFDVISSGTRTSEKRTMIDIAAAREGFRDMEISDIGFIRSAHNIADGLTKKMSRQALQNVLKTSSLTFECEQWIIRQ